MDLITKLKRSGSGVRKIVEAIEDASVPSGGEIVRWQDLRLVRGRFLQNNLLIPLDNDGNLVQQLEGMWRWCARFAPALGLSPAEADLLALAYTARQLDGANVLLNGQDAASNEQEIDKLKTIVKAVLHPAGDSAAASVFDRLARQKTGTERTDALGQCLHVARAAFYVETGVSALHWLLHGEELWTHDTAREHGLPQKTLSEEAGHTAMRLAANAYHNNARILWREAPATFRELVEGPIPSETWRILFESAYPESLKIAKAANPSYDRSPKRPEWPLVLRLPLAKDKPFAAQY